MEPPRLVDGHVRLPRRQLSHSPNPCPQWPDLGSARRPDLPAQTPARQRRQAIGVFAQPDFPEQCRAEMLPRLLDQEGELTEAVLVDLNPLGRHGGAPNLLPPLADLEAPSALCLSSEL